MDDSHSTLEQCVLGTAALLVATAVVTAVIREDPGGLARVLGLLALACVAIAAISRGVRRYRAGMPAALPTSVARVRMRTRPARALSLITVTLALVLPLVLTVVLLVLVEWVWLLVAAVLLVGIAGVALMREAETRRPYTRWSARASTLLERLCMRADMPVPELAVDGHVVANAWTAGGRIHLTTRLLKLLDDAELEAVLAHEVAHLARRDAAVMEVCSAPSGVLLSFTGYLTPRLPRFTWQLAKSFVPFGGGVLWAMWIVAVLGIPPAFVIGWISRLSVLVMSRAREFSADAAAATLTGRPSALASALLKLDRQRDWAPRSDLREVEGHAVLCIVGACRSRLGRLFSTHPATAARVKRLEEIEGRMHAGPYAGGLPR